jgi:hypothetical protein
MRAVLKKWPLDLLPILLAVILAAFLSHYTYKLRDRWPGVPPAPTQAESLSYGLGDVQYSYRNIGMMLQNAGDIGGRVTNLRDYDFEILRDWFNLSFELDPRAGYVPGLAAFYYGGTPKHEDLKYLVDYLSRAGKYKDRDASEENWRWLAHAVFLARFRLKDQDKALQLAEDLAAISTPDMPIWTQQMPAFVLTKVGQKKAARDLLLTIAATDRNIDPADINQTCWYIQHNLREPDDGLDTNPVYQALCPKIIE